MALASAHFTTDVKDPNARARLKACSEINIRHIMQGQPNEPGLKEAVSRIQDALRAADFSINITDDDGVYGPSTAAAVFKFKSGHKPLPILGPGQSVPDRVVGIQTIAALDKVMGGLPKPDVAGQFQDIVIRILGFDPNDEAAGKRTTGDQEEEGTDGQDPIGVPSVVALRALINTAKYLTLHEPVVVLNFNGGGGRAKPSSDPTSAILNALKAERAKAAANNSELGKIIVYGWSIGGRAAANVARAIKADPQINQPVDYLGLIDAAWDDKADTARTLGVTVSGGDSIFQSASNVLNDDPDSGITEFHGPVRGIANVDLNHDGSFFSRKLTEFLNSKPIRKKAAAFAFFNLMHKTAVTIGHRGVQTKILGILGV